jgi:hypothetical protein
VWNTPVRVNIRPAELLRRRSKSRERFTVKKQMQDPGSNYEPWGTLRGFFCGEGCEESCDRVRCRYVGRAILDRLDYFGCGSVAKRLRPRFEYPQDASMDVELSRMHEGIQPQPN